jgi:hypothetical protein
MLVTDSDRRPSTGYPARLVHARHKTQRRLVAEMIDCERIGQIRELDLVRGEPDVPARQNLQMLIRRAWPPNCASNKPSCWLTSDGYTSSSPAEPAVRPSFGTSRRRSAYRALAANGMKVRAFRTSTFANKGPDSADLAASERGSEATGPGPCRARGALRRQTDHPSSSVGCRGRAMFL